MPALRAYARFDPFAFECFWQDARVTRLEAVQRSAEFLEKKGIESPRLNAELLLAHLLQVPRLKLYLDFDKVLTDTQVEQYRGFVKRRGLNEPLQHVVGSVSFCGYEIRTRPGALIPRPETEILAEFASKWLKELAKTKEAPTFVDIGAGTGCLAIAIVKQAPLARAFATDISETALTLAHENAEALSARIEFFHGDLFEPLPADLRFDLVVSNPPYIPSAEIETLSPEVRDHDPRLALDGGPDGLDFYRRLAVEAPARVAPGGRLMAEFGDGQAEAIRDIFFSRDWIVESIREDYTARPRFFEARLK